MAVAELQARVQQIQGPRTVRTPLPMVPALADLVPGGLRSGGAYSVIGSTSLAMSLLAGPSAAGSWCGVVGLPTFGAEAAAGVGVDLARTILVPDPGEQWLSVTSTLVDVLPVVVLRPPSRVYDAEASRLTARLRQRGATLITLHDQVADAWPRTEARLEVVDSSWAGLGAGHGHLQARRITVSATGRWGRPQLTRLWLDRSVRPVVTSAPPLSGTMWSQHAGNTQPQRHAQRPAAHGGAGAGDVRELAS